MKRTIRLLIVILTCAVAVHVSATENTSITEEQLRADVDALVAFGTRHAKRPEAEQAAQWLEAQLQDAGFTIDSHTFTLDDIEMRNVVGVLPAPDAKRILVLGAHYDSINSEGQDEPAPGADDNASGVAAVLACARALAKQQLDAELRVIFFTAEEIGVKGSKRYVEQALEPGDRKVAALIVDYIGTETGAPDGVMILHDKRSRGLTKNIEAVAAEHVPDLHLWPMRSEMFRTFGDYEGFWKAGHPAVMFVREYHNDALPNEVCHSADDTPDHMRWSQVLKVTELVYFTALKMAGVQ